MKIAAILWTEDRIAQLRDLRGVQGLSCGQVAATLGVSKNSVIGKLARLRIKAPEKAKPVKAAKAIRKGNSPRSVMPKPAVTHDASGGRQTIAIMDLEFSSCRWPYETPAGVRYCGAATVDLRSYCSHHHAIAYVSSKMPRVSSFINPIMETSDAM